MSMLDISPKDAMRGVVIDPAGWYTVRIDAVLDSAPSKKGDSENILLEGTILQNADSGEKKFENYPTPFWLFNTKAPGFVVGLLRALGIEVVPGRFNLKVVEGRVLDVFIKNDVLDGGRVVSKVEHQYRPAK